MSNKDAIEVALIANEQYQRGYTQALQDALAAIGEDMSYDSEDMFDPEMISGYNQAKNEIRNKINNN